PRAPGTASGRRPGTPDRAPRAGDDGGGVAVQEGGDRRPLPDAARSGRTIAARPGAGGAAAAVAAPGAGGEAGVAPTDCGRARAVHEPARSAVLVGRPGHA